LHSIIQQSNLLVDKTSTVSSISRAYISSTIIEYKFIYGNGLSIVLRVNTKSE